MLVISRKIGEKIRIGKIQLVVVDTRADRVRIGIQAPKSIPVHREEIYQAILREAGIDPDDENAALPRSGA